MIDDGSFGRVTYLIMHTTSQDGRQQARGVEQASHETLDGSQHLGECKVLGLGVVVADDALVVAEALALLGLHLHVGMRVLPGALHAYSARPRAQQSQAVQHDVRHLLGERERHRLATLQANLVQGRAELCNVLGVLLADLRQVMQQFIFLFARERESEREDS